MEVGQHSRGSVIVVGVQIHRSLRLCTLFGDLLPLCHQQNRRYRIPAVGETMGCEILPREEVSNIYQVVMLPASLPLRTEIVARFEIEQPLPKASLSYSFVDAPQTFDATLGSDQR